MIDIHSHILWGLDDGARTLDESVGMLQLAVEAGTTDIVATPHANFRYRYDRERVEERIREIAVRAPEGLRIHRGCDFHLSYDNIQDAVASPARYVIGGGPYLLVEFPETALRGMRDALETLLRRGLVPIMTHPERHGDLQKINADFLEWVRMGCLVQVTGQSLLGRFGKKAEEAAWEMLRRGLVHFVASDAHGVQDRTPRLDEAHAAVVRRCGEAVGEAVFVENPRAVLSGEPFRRSELKRRSWYPFRK